MSGFSQIAEFQQLMIYPFASLGASYSLIGTISSSPARIVKMTNTTNKDVLISYDGTTNHDILPANSFVLYDISSNSGIKNVLVLPEGTSIYAKYVDIPTEGAVYMTIISARGD